MHWNGSWALFSTEKQPIVGLSNGEYAPVSHSGNKPTLEKHDSALIQNLRKWAVSYFTANDVLSKDMYISLKMAKS